MELAHTFFRKVKDVVMSNVEGSVQRSRVGRTDMSVAAHTDLKGLTSKADLPTSLHMMCGQQVVSRWRRRVGWVVVMSRIRMQMNGMMRICRVLVMINRRRIMAGIHVCRMVRHSFLVVLDKCDNLTLEQFADRVL